MSVPTENAEDVSFKVAFGKTIHDITMPLSSTVSDLKTRVESLTGIPPECQKLLYKGMLKDDAAPLSNYKLQGQKVMLMASKVDDILKIATTVAETKKLGSASIGSTQQMTWSDMTEHKKVIEKGKPQDAEPGFKNKKMSLPPGSMIKGLYNKFGSKARLTFKKDLDQLWIGTTERTQKLPLNSIKSVTSQPIAGFEEYHILALQLGPTEKSNYYLYWVPAQYIDTIKEEILGIFAIFQQ